MAGMLDSFVQMTTQLAWLAFTMCALAFAAGTVTFIWHIRESHSRRHAWLLISAGVCMTVGFLLGGMQAGDEPIISRAVLIPWIRICWFWGGALGVAFLTRYWMLRIKIVRVEP